MKNKEDIRAITAQVRVLLIEKQRKSRVFINTIETLLTLLEEGFEE